MASFWVLLIMGIMVIGIIAYANPQLWEDVKVKIIGILKFNPPNCPQVNVSIEAESFSEPTIQSRTYDGWSIKSEDFPITCRSGNKEGENIGYYYCGGVKSIFGIQMINAYIEKTNISNDGSIGETYKYIIWNIYDENKQFVETQCTKYPENLEQERAKEFEKEMLKWN